jgi:nucleotide-binding universal stress UspA family protein
VFKNVLVGIDGRPNGRDGLALASRLLDPEAGGKLTLANVRGGELRPLHAVTPAMASEEREASLRMLAAERDQAQVEAEAELVSVVAASPGRGLHEQAEEQRADLIVVGSCSHGAFGRVMLGDDTRAALNGSPCAVAIAARGYAEYPTPIAKVGVGYDDSPEARAALALAKELARPTRASVEALEVVSVPSYAYTGLMPPAIGESIDLMLDEATKRMQALDGVEGRAAYGLAGEELAAFGDALDLLVVGSRSYGPVKRLVLGSTSEYLARHARCSLVVLPRTAIAAAAAQDGAGAPGGLRSAAADQPMT